jgi:hypothetical protein
MDAFHKQPREIRDINFDFRPWLALRPGVVATNYLPTVSTGLTLVGASMPENGLVKVVIGGGTDRASYKVSVLLETNTPQKREADCRVHIREL